ncbi:hypothetical protein DCC79_14140 [bacterium]|nr:MAG: hypothetical protein DCC79_14140 [bacterium]
MGIDRAASLRRGAAWRLAVAGATAWLAAAPPPAAAQGRSWCGEITSNTVWREADRPHILTCDVVVRNSTLVIQPGAQVLMNAGTSLIVKAGAALQAPGNPQARQTVQFLPNDREITPGFWGQILVEAGAGESVLNDVSVRGGGHGDKPMVELHSPVALNQMSFQSALGVPLALRADVVGPSLEIPGPQPGACTAMTFSRNGADGIRVLSGLTGDGDIVTTQSWYNLCVPYLVPAGLRIGGPDAPILTLNQGVVVKFGPGSALIAGIDDANRGQLDLSGGSEPGKEVVLTGMTDTPGAWPGMDLTEFVDPDGLGHSFINARVQHGGQGGRPMVRIRTPLITAADSVFAHAAGYPVEIIPDAVDGLVSGLNASGGDAFVQNGVQRIRVDASAEADVTISANWKNPGLAGKPVPFEIDGDLTVAGPTRAATLQVQAGVELVFKDGAELVVGDAALGRGGLETKGTAREPVVMTSLSDRPGTWKGVRLTDAALTAQLTGLRLENGGQGGRAMLEWGRVAGLMTESTLTGATGYPVSIALSNVPAIIGEEQQDPARRNAYTGNGTDRILVRADAPYTDKLARWADPGVPVEFTDTAVVAKATGIALTLSPGLELWFPAGKAFQVGDRNARAAVVFEGEAGRPLRLRPVDPAAGWGGVRVIAGASLDARHVEITGAADDAANVTVDGGVLSLHDGWRIDGGGRGTGVDAFGASARLDLSGGTVTGHRVGIRTRDGARLDISRSVVGGNTEWGIRNEDPALCQLAKLVYWGRPGGPTDPSDAEEGCMNTAWEGGGDKVSDHVNWWPYATDDATFPPAPGLGPNAARVFVPVAANAAPLR